MTKFIMVRHEAGQVQIIHNGKLICMMPPEKVKELVVALKKKSGEAEQFNNAEQVAFDQALLTRVGVPIGITDNPKIRDMAATEVAWNKTLRSAVKGIKSDVMFGKAGIYTHEPRKNDN